MKKLITALLAPALVLVSSGAAYAASQVKLSNDIFVERQKQRADGTVVTTLEEPTLVTPGDNLVFVVKFKNTGAKPAEKFVVTNPMPKAVAFNGTSDGLEVVSVDGGKSWGFSLRSARSGCWRQFAPGSDGRCHSSQMEFEQAAARRFGRQADFSWNRKIAANRPGCRGFIGNSKQVRRKNSYDQ